MIFDMKAAPWRSFAERQPLIYSREQWLLETDMISVYIVGIITIIDDKETKS